MEKAEINQVQCGDYFMFKGEIVKIRSLYIGKKFKNNDYSVFVETKNGRRFYVDIEDLQPITINDYTLKQAGAIPHEHNEAYDIGEFILYFHHGELFLIEHIFTDIQITMDITYFHVLQNALCLFGVEVELK